MSASISILPFPFTVFCTLLALRADMVSVHWWGPTNILNAWLYWMFTVCSLLLYMGLGCAICCTNHTGLLFMLGSYTYIDAAIFHVFIVHYLTHLLLTLQHQAQESLRMLKQSLGKCVCKVEYKVFWKEHAYWQGSMYRLLTKEAYYVYRHILDRYILVQACAIQAWRH